MKNTEEKIFYKTPIFYIWLATIVVILVIIIIIKANEKPKISEIPYTQMSTGQQDSYLNNFIIERRSKLESIIEEAVSKQLKAPSEADFVGDMHFKVDQYITKQIMAYGYVDAPNSFGVKLRIGYRCLFSIANNDGDIEILKTAIDE